MKYDRMIITQFIQLRIKIETQDEISHSVVTQYANEIDQIISQGLEFTAQLLRSFEKEKVEELKRIGK